jgi:hypothetical protein
MGKDVARRERPAQSGELAHRARTAQSEVCLVEVFDEDLHLGLGPTSGDPPARSLTGREAELVAGPSQGLPVDVYSFLGQLGEDFSRLHGHLRE